MVHDNSGKLVAIFPCAEVPNCDGTVASHPGLTYGGLVHGLDSEPDRVVAIVQAICDHFFAAGYSELIYRSRPVHLHAGWRGLDEYALWRCGGEIIQRDLWNVVSLRDGRRCSSEHRNQSRRALRAGLRAEMLSLDDYPAFHDALVHNLQSRYQVKPVHCLEELRLLACRFPKQIELWGMLTEDEVSLAYVWLFKFGRLAWHTQYIVGTPEGQKIHAVRSLLEHLLTAAEREGVASFSFGRSTEGGGRLLNAGLFTFKSRAGRGSVIQDVYRLSLQK